ncbi:MAG: hypothetical protein HYZ31_11760 [Gammaproteobacteria bacterium]|nr:hypothetical protein [Gammaproteobacteria bacterium]
MRKILYILIPVILVWFSILAFYTESLDPGFDEFYSQNQAEVSDTENAAVGIAGLNAPPDVDFMRFGRDQIKNSIADMLSHEKGIKRNEIEGEIKFIGNANELGCWVSQPDAIKNYHLACATDMQLQKMLIDNKILLKRYREITKLRKNKVDAGLNGTLFLNINKLIAAEIKINLNNGRYEDAYLEWENNYKFLERLLASDVTWIDEAIYMVASSISINSAELLINHYPDIVTVHGDELLNSLKPLGLERWNLTGIMRAEYNMFRIMLESTKIESNLDLNFIRNRFYRSAKSYLIAAKSAPINIEEESLKVSTYYSDFDSNIIDYLHAPRSTILTRLWLRGHLKTGNIITTMYYHDSKLRILTLAIMIKKQGVNEAEIVPFIADSSKSLNNPFTGQPMKYDSKERALVFIAPGGNNKFYAHL